jgi:YegS/Rv2252/BmrU family lipid kinase
VTRELTLLVNPTSGGGRALGALPAVTAELDRLGAGWRSVATRSLSHAAEEASAAADAGRAVGALGGDGLLRPLAGALRGREVPLAVFPCGRGNDFARVLGIPRDPVEAARIAVAGEERLVDVAEVDGTTFVGIASLGFDSDANRIANDTKRLPGNAVYLYAALRAMAGWRPATFMVDVDGERFEFSGYSVAVGNSKAYGGGMYLLPHAELDDGLLDVFTCADAPKWRALRDLPKVFKGTHLDAPYVATFRGAEVHVDADRPFEIYADGDPIAATPATITVERTCLRVLVPG